MTWLAQLKNASLIEPLGWTILHSLWQGIVIAIIAAVLLRLTRSRSAQIRYVIACLALFSMLIAAVVTFVELRPARIPEITGSPIHLVTPTIQPVQINEPISTVHPIAPSLTDRIRPILPSLALAWIAGVFLLGAYHAGGWMLLRRLRIQSRTIADVSSRAMLTDLIAAMRINRTVQLCESVLVQVPTVIGWLTPIILLPASAVAGLSPSELRGLLAHELAHIRRHDYLVNLLQTVIETLLFYHPATWWLSKTIRQERENCCDDFAAAVCDRTIYAQALASMELLRQSPQLALSAKGAALLPRIRRILGMPTTTNRRPLSSGIVSASILVAVIAGGILLNACRSSAKVPTTEPSPPTTQADDIAYTDPTEADVKPPPEQDYRIVPNDVLNIVINAPYRSQKWTGTVRVKDDGTIALQDAGLFKAQGLTEKDLARQIENGRSGITATVTVTEGRGRVFSIRGGVDQPGQYAIPKADFRLNDAITLSHGLNTPVTSIYVIRNQTAHASQRIIRIPVDQLHTDPRRYNIVIYPDDLVQVTPDDPAAMPDQPIQTVAVHSNDVDFKVTARHILSSFPSDDELRPSTRPASETGAYNISGQVARPGQFDIPFRNFRLLDALAQSQGTTPSAKTVVLWRGDSDTMRMIYIPLDQLHNQPEAFNLVICPKDQIVVGSFTMMPLPASTQQSNSSQRTLQGHITEAATGKPVPNVKVKIYAGDVTRYLTDMTTTDANGNYRFDNPSGNSIQSSTAPDAWDVMVGMRIDDPTMCSADGNSWWDVTIPHDTRFTTKNFTLMHGGKLFGTVNNSRGDGDANLDLKIWSKDNRSWCYATTDQHGQFTSESLFPGDYVIAVNGTGYPHLASAQVRSGQNSQLELHFDPPATTATTTAPSPSQDSAEEIQYKLNLARSRLQTTQLKLHDLEGQSGKPGAQEQRVHLDDQLSELTGDQDRLQIALALALHEVFPSPAATTAPTTMSSTPSNRPAANAPDLASVDDINSRATLADLQSTLHALDHFRQDAQSKLDAATKAIDQNSYDVSLEQERLKSIDQQRDWVAKQIAAKNAQSHANTTQSVSGTASEIAPNSPATQPALPETGEYYVSGVPRTGVYGLGRSKQITLLQALISAGIEQWAVNQKLTVIHKNGSRSEFKMSDVMNEPVGQTPVQADDVLMVVNLPEGEYYVGGEDIPRVGVYSLTGHQVNVLQALIAAGVDPALVGNDVVEIRHRVADDKMKIDRVSVRELLDDPSKDEILEPNDQLFVHRPTTTQPTTKP